MGKKKHAEHVNHERWLVSYADLLTLLFAFFVVLFASSVADKKKTAAMAAAMQTAFSESGAFDAHAKTPPLEPGAGNSQGPPTPLMMTLPTSPEESGKGTGEGPKALEKAVEKATANEALRGSMTIRAGEKGTTISLDAAGLFASGSADLDGRAAPLLRKIAATLPDRELRVEGHTDNQPMHSERFRSNFELSTARASAVAAVLLESSRVTPSHFALAGYGEFRPIESNATAEGRAKNRRVDIVVLGAPVNTVPVAKAVSVSAARTVEPHFAPNTTVLPVAPPQPPARLTLREQLDPVARAGMK